MFGAALRKPEQSPRRRSPRLKNIRVAYAEDCKTEIVYPEETTSDSTSELNVASLGGNDAEQDLHNVTLKDLRALCKAKNQKAQKIIFEGPGSIMHQTQCGDLENEIPKEVVDLDEPLIALKQKKQKSSPSKAKRKMDAPTSSDSAKVEDTTSKRGGTNLVQALSVDAILLDSMKSKLERRATDLEHSEIAIVSDHNEEIVGVCAGMEKTIVYKIKVEDIDTYLHEEAGVSSFCQNNSFEHSSVEMHQVSVEDAVSGQQAGFTQATELDVSDHSCEPTHSVEAFLDDNVVQHKTIDDIASSDVDNSSTVSDVLLCSLNQSCEELVDNHEYWYPGVVQGNTLEDSKTVEDSSTAKFNTEMWSSSVVIRSDLCGSTQKNCPSLKEVEQMQAEGPLDSLPCQGVRIKDTLLHMNVEQEATDYNFTFDKTLDLVYTPNFGTQDGRLESIVFDALNNHVQRKNSETTTFVGVSDTAVTHDNQLLLANDMVRSSNDMDQLNGTLSGEISTPFNDKDSREEFGFQRKLFQACDDGDKTIRLTSESSSHPEETQKIRAGASNSIATSQGTDGQTELSEFVVDEESIEEHTPKKLLSKRKIMSPTSQEKLCNALTGIDLCGVKRLKRKIHVEDCDQIRQTLPQTANKQDQSILSTDRRLKGRTCVSYTSKGVLKSTESQSPPQTSRACMRSSPVLLDTRKAVEFSERQMHDIESIAANLIRSLKHMRSIVDGSLSSEAHSLIPNFNSAEIRAASEDALEVERTTRKWLAIMNKDCNRFCKILTLEGKKAVPHSEVPKKRRKIVFADEAGGTLCHVKVFNDEQTSLSECQIEL